MSMLMILPKLSADVAMLQVDSADLMLLLLLAALSIAGLAIWLAILIVQREKRQERNRR